MTKLICTTYNQQGLGSLQLRNNWVEDVQNEGHLLELLHKYEIYSTEDILTPAQKGISATMIGTFTIPYTEIHVRMINY